MEKGRSRESVEREVGRNCDGEIEREVKGTLRVVMGRLERETVLKVRLRKDGEREGKRGGKGGGERVVKTEEGTSTL